MWDACCSRNKKRRFVFVENFRYLSLSLTGWKRFSSFMSERKFEEEISIVVHESSWLRVRGLRHKSRHVMTVIWLWLGTFSLHVHETVVVSIRPQNCVWIFLSFACLWVDKALGESLREPTKYFCAAWLLHQSNFPPELRCEIKREDLYASRFVIYTEGTRARHAQCENNGI